LAEIEEKLLRQLKDTEASASLKKALAAISGVERRDRHRYGSNTRDGRPIDPP
jgi:hypothetical protein